MSDTPCDNCGALTHGNRKDCPYPRPLGMETMIPWKGWTQWRDEPGVTYWMEVDDAGNRRTWVDA